MRLGSRAAQYFYWAGSIDRFALFLAASGNDGIVTQFDAINLDSLQNPVAAATLGTVTRKIEVFDATGSSLGFVPVYGSIT